jgi:hypothetical protein
MKPIFSAWPAKKKNRFFGIFAGGIFFLSFLLVAFATQIFFLALLLPPVLGVVGAWALVGWPSLQMKDGRPLVEPRHRPYLFFLLAPLFAFVLYPVLGIISTQTGLPLGQWVTVVLIVLSVALAVTITYFLVGVPNVYVAARRRYEEIPADRRPFLFFPITVVLFLIIYLTLGVTSTRLLGQISPGDPTALLNIQVLVLTPLCLGLAALIAYLLVGIPKPAKSFADSMPKVTGKHRPRIFLATAILVGILLTIVLGAILTIYAPLPSTVVLGLAVLLGFTLSTSIAALAWGTPARWRQYDDYTPGVDPRLRIPLLLGVSLATGIAIAIAIGLANIDLFWGILAGSFATGIVLIFLTGTHRRIAARRGQSTLIPDLPDGMKPLILFPTWFLISLVLFAVLTYALPGLVPLNALFALLVGLCVTFFLLEQPLLKDVLAERRREKEKRRAWEARRKQRLAEAAESTSGPEA